MINRKWFEHLWPWSQFYRLRVESGATRAMLMGIIYELDPYYVERKLAEIYISSPRMNCIITGLDQPR